MTASEIIEFAKKGELKGVNVSNDNDTLLSYINLGVIELYKRFSLKTSHEILNLSSINNEYTISDPNILMVIGAFNEFGIELTLNDELDPTSIMTPEYNKIWVNTPWDNGAIDVIFRAGPTSLLTDVSDTVPIPITLLEPLLHYLGYRGHGSMNGDIKAENNTHYMRFEKSCNEVTALGLITSDTQYTDKRWKGLP